ncbi:hypothetical protein KC19_12G059300 [Ceratodon purpureus]|uniref:Uncharacterized protein n=1 Tax=Ceratodon purpureus TaxID=3225 RepID=A0A8T0G587_CERPU|nr:hypothetical protein KC19_12G059300 [Ceratodon purpureus]
MRNNLMYFPASLTILTKGCVVLAFPDPAVVDEDFGGGDVAEEFPGVCVVSGLWRDDRSDQL